MSNIVCAIGNLQYAYSMKKLGTLIRDARERLGLHGYELANAIDKQPSYVTRLESGETKTLPPPEVLERLGATLHLSMRKMVETAGYDLGPPGDPNADLHTTIDVVLAPVLEHPKVVEAIVENIRHTVAMWQDFSQQPPSGEPEPRRNGAAPVQSPAEGR